MAATKKTFTGATTTEIIAADVHRDYLTVQLHSSSNPIYLAFGEDAVAATGLALFYPGCSVRVVGPKAQLAVNGIDAGSSAVVGVETMQDVEYRSGAFDGPFDPTPE